MNRARFAVRDLSKAFFGIPVLHGVSFEIASGSVLGIVGENGCGKSTTMNVLTGVIPRDGGTVLLDGEPFNPRSRADSDREGIAYIQQELNVFPNLSVAENLFLARLPRVRPNWPLLSRARLRRSSQDLLDEVELDASPDLLAGQLSPGERQLLEIARGLAGDARVFMFDEPTSSMTSKEATRLFSLIRNLKSKGASILYISHQLDEVLALADQVMVMRDGRGVRLLEAASARPSDLIVAMTGRGIEQLFPVREAAAGGAPVILEAQGLTEPGVLNEISLTVQGGEILGIAGLMGSGRTELARALFGLDRCRKGRVFVEGRSLPNGNIAARLAAGVAFLTEDRRLEGLMMEASVADNMALRALRMFVSRWTGKIRQRDLLDAVRRIGRQLRLTAEAPESMPVSSLSGGNQQKVVLGRWLMRNPRVMILDEPTRGVDVAAKQEIYQLLIELAARGAAILIISSEWEELMGLCDRIEVMHRGELVAGFERGAFDREQLLRAAFGQSVPA
jgi:ribose transport system ATP-binding protein